MPLSMNDFSEPSFIRYKPGPTLSRDERAKYMNYDDTRYYRVTIQGGYNAQNPSVRLPRVKLDTDVVNVPRR